jgi:hypothetical protein
MAADGQAESIGCGAGRDTVYADANDRVFACEVVRRAR